MNRISIIKAILAFALVGAVYAADISYNLSDGDYAITFGDGTGVEIIWGDQPQQGTLDINAATLSQLMELPGIGEKKAAAIIEYRESCGEFEYFEELDEVEGIGEALLEKIRPYVCVS